MKGSRGRPRPSRILLFALTAAGSALLAADEAVSPVKAFEVTASRFKYEPALIEVSEGDRVRLTLHSIDTTHGIEIPAFGVKAVIPKGGQPVSVEFVADRVGSFPFKCSEYCGSGHRGMRGALVVTPRSQ